MTNSKVNNLISSLAIVATATLTACGGGGGGGSTAAPGATSATVAVSPLTPVVPVPSPPAIVIPPVAPIAPVTPPLPVVIPPVMGATPAYTVDKLPGSTYAVGSVQRAMFESLNRLRIGGGFGALEQDTRIDQAATAHADYVTANYFKDGRITPDYYVVQSDGWYTAHTETQGMPGFTGSRPANRISATGYQVFMSGEVSGVLVGKKVGAEPDMTTCLSDLINTVFHRAALLDTAYLDVGFGIGKPIIDSNGFILRPCVINFGAKQAAPVLAQNWIGLYPFDGQSNISLVMAGEVPDPVPSSPIKGGPVSIQTGAFQNLVVGNFTLRDTSGQIVNSKFLTRAESSFLRTNEAYLVPIGSLAPSTKYFVTFSGTSNGTLINKNWSFTTAAK